ncbi:MAG TPA: response regulator [Candidatus Angelobacter sp.]|nr:response regulator [Candidatus Angelobacter sp.]
MTRPVLYLEDTTSDAQLAMREFTRLGVADRVVHLKDGSELLNYLRCIEHPDQGKPNDVPALVILDLGVPEVHGMQLLNILRSRSQFRRIPVVIFSGSEDPKMVAAAYEAGACSFIWKSGQAEQFRNALKGIIDYWTNLNQIPD